ncbi:hypothetical protein LINPERHAP1_LOCUS14648 [Linum perenne]
MVGSVVCRHYLRIPSTWMMDQEPPVRDWMLKLQWDSSNIDYKAAPLSTTSFGSSTPSLPLEPLYCPGHGGMYGTHPRPESSLRFLPQNLEFRRTRNRRLKWVIWYALPNCTLHLVVNPVINVKFYELFCSVTTCNLETLKLRGITIDPRFGCYAARFPMLTALNLDSCVIFFKRAAGEEERTVRPFLEITLSEALDLQ